MSCNCVNLNIETPPLDPTCPTLDCGDCIYAASPVIESKDSVGPCGKQGLVRLSQINETGACTGSVIYSLIGYDESGIDDVVITTAGDVTFVTSDNAKPKHYYQITYKMLCDNENVGGIGVITVGIKDLCEFKSCTAGCDSCTGECKDANVNLSIGIS